LMEYFDNDKYKCPVCGRIFKSIKAVSIHIAKSHSILEAPTIYPGEGLEIKKRGSFVEVKLRIKRTLWNDIEKRTLEKGIRLDDLIFDCLSNLAAFGNNWSLWKIAENKEEATYIT